MKSLGSNPSICCANLRRRCSARSSPFRDFSSAEDAVQEAMIAAFTQWPQEGNPENPRGWLIQVALRRMTDHVRSETSRRNREFELALETETLSPPRNLQRAGDGSRRMR